MPYKKLINLSNLTLLVALSLSTVAAYYSIIGLTAIFAGAVIPVIIMGSMLEVGKITTTVWLRKYWSRCSWLLKLYLVPAVVLLAILTSMGIFGFLSKAHMDQGLLSGDSQSKLALYDEKIKTQRDNIDIARKALQQMDAQVDARLSRGESEQGAERAVQIRRQQANERAKLQKEISDAQKEITKLNEERAPIAAENRKIEAEVGPIKYIAALIYGDNPDQNILEKAVRWVIILLVIVFDPLAIALVLAANASKEWDKLEDTNTVNDIISKPSNIHDSNNKNDDTVIKPSSEESKPEEKNEVVDEADQQKELKFLTYTPPVSSEKEQPDPEPTPKPNGEGNEDASSIITEAPVEQKNDEPKETETVSVNDIVPTDEIITEGVTKELPYQELPGGWVKHDGKTMQKEVLRRLMPELFAVPDNFNKVKTNFGTSFPNLSNRGDIFVRVDTIPNKVFKFDGSKWIEVNKATSISYLDNKNYVQFLINKIYSGEYDLDILTEDERSHIEEFLKNN